MANEQFKGRIGPTVTESKPWWPDLPQPREGAPNVVVILFDDTGFAHFGCYGSTIDDAEHRPARRRAACATPTSTPPRCARRRAPRC